MLTLRTAVVLGCLIAPALALPRPVPKPAAWVRIESPHFEVLTDGDEDQGRDVAAQLERMRAMFMEMLPGIKDPALPVQILAVKNKREFMDLTPPDLFGKGKPDYVSFLMPTAERTEFLVRLDSVADANYLYPYGVIYSAYAQILIEQSSVHIPDWLTFGMGEFYETAEIDNHNAVIGKVNRGNLEILQNRALLPVSVLMSADVNTPEWNRTDRRELFDAESWALVHYLLTNDQQKHTHQLQTYIARLATQAPEEAAVSTFGDLDQFQKTLIEYSRHLSFTAMAVNVSTKTDKKTYIVEPIPLERAEATRADFMVNDERFTDARLQLEAALKQDPNDAAAMASMGLLESRQNNDEAARQWYQKSIQLDASDYLTQYRFGRLSLDSPTPESATADADIEASFRAAIKLNPQFAPAYDGLARVFLRQRQHLDEADSLELQAITLDPSQFYYRYNAAIALLDAQNFDAAAQVLTLAKNYAKNVQETSQADQTLREIASYSAEKANVDRTNQRIAALNQQMSAAAAASTAFSQHRDAAEAEATAATPVPILVRTDPNPKPKPTGVPQSISGQVQSVYCSGSNGIDIALNIGAKTSVFHSDDYFKVAFTAVNFTPKGLLQPCQQLEGLNAKIDYLPSTDSEVAGVIVAVHLTQPKAKH
ncbi:MAG TPA: hypothetical protein VN709_03945 [Terriglobales bacterium]|nr:hypothetical protein [Terriglobales bacterium]